MASAISAAKATVFLVEDHPILAQGLKALIDDESDLAVCGMAVDADASLAAIVAARPSVAIVDLTLRSGNGLDLIKALRERLPDLPTLVLSMHDESLYAERALRAGARGYVMKKEASERILAALRKVLAGEVYVSEKTASKMLSGIVEGRGARGGAPLERLSDREFEIFNLISQGIGPSEIAQKLGLSVKTIETHREHIKEKLGLKNAAELIRFAFQHQVEQG